MSSGEQTVVRVRAYSRQDPVGCTARLTGQGRRSGGSWPAPRLLMPVVPRDPTLASAAHTRAPLASPPIVVVAFEHPSLKS
jgi:hypothetical protein